MQYEILISILDALRAEGCPKYKAKFACDESDIDKINAGRSRAFIHLFLKVSFGITDVDEREHCTTDGAYDGGIDGYYISSENKKIYLIQSKFRSNQKNFENKSIELREILNMEIDRVLAGEKLDELGNAYSGKIQQLQREISNIPDIARYQYQVILLANLLDVSPAQLRKLSGGYPVEVFHFEKTYERLVFPVVSGTYFTANEICIPIDLSNKNAGSKISYTVQTKIGECEITLLFVPTIEIAKIMNKYRNSVLKFNPRSYLDFDGQLVNNSIRETMTKNSSNEFALFNNGITMLSEETNLNEKIGQKNKAQLIIKNPQIINGGQTSYTLSRIFQESSDTEREMIFNEKEVLLKIITLSNSEPTSRLQIIEQISEATNKQTAVINADRRSNEDIHFKIQKLLFEKYGLLYERKRGEFSDGIRDGYLATENVIERNLFLRVYFAANGNIQKSTQKRLFLKFKETDINLEDSSSFDRFYIGLYIFRSLKRKMMRKNTELAERRIAPQVYAYMKKFPVKDIRESIANMDQTLDAFEEEWDKFIEHRSKNLSKRKARAAQKLAEQLSALTSIEGEESKTASTEVSHNLARDVSKYF